jgi:hypothetical protein
MLLCDEIKTRKNPSNPSLFTALDVSDDDFGDLEGCGDGGGGNGDVACGCGVGGDG